MPLVSERAAPSFDEFGGAAIRDRKKAADSLSAASFPISALAFDLSLVGLAENDAAMFEAKVLVPLKLRDEIVIHRARHVRQAEVAARVAIRQAFMVDAQ